MSHAVAIIIAMSVFLPLGAALDETLARNHAVAFVQANAQVISKPIAAFGNSGLRTGFGSDPIGEDGHCVDDDGKYPNYYMKGSMTLNGCKAQCDADANCAAWEWDEQDASGSQYCVCYGSKITEGNTPEGWSFQMEDATAGDPTGGACQYCTAKCYLMSRSSDDSDTTGISGDPHVWYDGVRTSIHLPTDRLTKLLEQDHLAIYAKGGPKGEAKMNYIFVVAVYEDDKELMRLEQELGHLDGHHALMKLTAEGVTRHVSRNVTALAELSLRSTREKVVLLHERTGVSFVVSSRKTTRRDATNSHHLNIRFNRKSIALSGTGAAKGALPEIWGLQPLSPEVASLIRHRSKSRSSRSAAGVEDGFVGSDGETL